MQEVFEESVINPAGPIDDAPHGSGPGRYRDYGNDRYEVYVNQDFIGQKKIYSPIENIFDLEDFLREQGISDFQFQLDGNHFYITEITPLQEAYAKEMLHIYLQNY